MDALIKENVQPCKWGAGAGAVEEGRPWWGMNGIRQKRPFLKMASRQNFSFSVAEWLFIISQNILVKLSVGSARVSFFFCLKKENSNTRKLRKNFSSSK